jgi:hypothetical protein
MIEEYKLKWEYIRHIEDKQVEFIKWYVIVLGAIFTYLSTTIKQLNDISFNQNWIILLSFLLIYSIVTSIFLLFLKRNYKLYNDRIVTIEHDYCSFDLKTHKKRFFTSFRIFYSLFIVFGSGVAGILGLALSGKIVFLIVSFCFYFITMLTISKFVKH